MGGIEISIPPILFASVSSVLKCLIATSLFLAFTQPAPTNAAPPGFLEGRLRIISSKEVELADGTPASGLAENYGDYPLVVLSQDRKQEVTRVAADSNGNYHIELPPGDYVLDIQRQPRGRVRATPQRFTVASGQTVHVDMEIDPGVR
jgi:hypothetical protein